MGSTMNRAIIQNTQLTITSLALMGVIGLQTKNLSHKHPNPPLNQQSYSGSSDVSDKTREAEVSVKYMFDFPFDGALNHLYHEEGLEDKAYKDSKGIKTVGIGHNLEAKGLCGTSIKTQFLCDLKDAEEGARRVVGDVTWHKMGDYRRLALVSMVFQMGEEGVRGFTAMVSAIRMGRYREAGRLSLLSKWAKKDTPARAARVAQMLSDNVLVLRDGHDTISWEDIR